MSIYYIIAPLLLSFLISILVGKILIPILKSKKLGQKILDIGPRWHKSKEGTPLMGGFLFIVGVLVSVVIFGIVLCKNTGNYKIIITFLMALSYGLIGFVDDYVKLFKKQNQGLTPIQKMIFQFLVAIIYIFVLKSFGYTSTETRIPFLKEYVNLGFFHYIFLVFGLVYFTNSTNFTDGIDGLCGSVTSIVMIFFIILFYSSGLAAEEHDSVTGVVMSSSMLGGLIGFLYYNFYPARVFMGDTGSLFLGGMIAGLAIWLDIPILLIFFGFIYIAESVSVMIQVMSFKLTGKRVFKMSPIHHHYEMCGWSEKKIVTMFSAITLAGCIISYISIV